MSKFLGFLVLVFLALPAVILTLHIAITAVLSLGTPLLALCKLLLAGIVAGGAFCALLLAKDLLTESDK